MREKKKRGRESETEKPASASFEGSARTLGALTAAAKAAAATLSFFLSYVPRQRPLPPKKKERRKIVAGKCVVSFLSPAQTTHNDERERTGFLLAVALRRPNFLGGTERPPTNFGA